MLTVKNGISVPDYLHKDFFFKENLALILKCLSK